MFAPSRSHHAVHPSQQSHELWTNELLQTLTFWQTEHLDSNYDPIPTLVRLSDLFELALTDLLRLDPDPLDDRHPSRTYPSSPLGHLLRNIFRYDDFMNKLVVSYLMARDNTKLSIAAARLLIDLVPGMDSAALFSEHEDLVPELYRLAGNNGTCRELRAYSFGLLSAALEVNSIAGNHKNENSMLMPIALLRLKELFEQMEHENQLRAQNGTSGRVLTAAFLEEEDENDPFALNPNERPTLREIFIQMANARRSQGQVQQASEGNTNEGEGSRNRRKSLLRIRDSEISEAISMANANPPNRKKPKIELQNERNASTASLASLTDSRSNNQWCEQQRRRLGRYHIYPVNIIVEQRMIIHYLTPIAEYQDLLKETFENRSLELVLRYLDDSNTRDSRLIFDVLKYLAGLLVHRKLALDFVAAGGVQRLMKIERDSLSSTVVGTCMYYIAYNIDAMEGVCSISEQVVTDVVKYLLWLLEHSYESGRAGASMFFAYAFTFRPILERFDELDGLRRLLNYISTLTLLQNDSDIALSDEHMFTSLQAVRNTTMAFKSYMASHMYMKVDHLKRTHLSRLQSIPNVTIPSSVNVTASNKGMILDSESTRQCVDILSHALSLHSPWRPVEEMRRLGVIRILLTVIGRAMSWHGGSKVEIIRNCLDALWFCSVNPRVQLDVCESKIKVKERQQDAIGVILRISEGRSVSDSEVQIAALQVITNCACAPMNRVPNKVLTTSTWNEVPSANLEMQMLPNRLSGASVRSKKQKKAHMETVDIMEKNWAAIRRNDGIMILKKMLYAEAPATDADRLRANACRALNGLARSESVRQILEIMPLISCSELCALIREPILPDMRAEHAMFCEQAHSLIERVTKKSVHELPKDLTKEKLWKWYIVEHTRVTFNEKELLQLIHQHLIKKGLTKTATELQKEADLPSIPASRVSDTVTCLSSLPSYYNTNVANDLLSRRSLRLDVSINNDMFVNDRAKNNVPSSTKIAWPSSANANSQQNISKIIRSAPKPSSTNVISKSVCANTHPSIAGREQKSTPESSEPNAASENQMLPYKNLDEIVTEYFRKQHSMCNNPVSTCPPFSLYYPHHCPEPRRRRFAPMNLAYRTLNRPIISNPWKERHYNTDKQFAFSRFRPVKAFSESEETFTCCNFSVDDEHILLGTYGGMVHWFNIRSGAEESNTECHQSALTGIEQSKDGSLLLTSSAAIKPLSSLWFIGVGQKHMINFPDEYHVQFSKSNQDLIIGTQGEKATIYDTETGRAVVRLYDESLANNYTRNIATFDPSDNMVLNDGVLWDRRVAQSALHKFDKLNHTNSGVFHPRGIEIIINSEVWDMRNYKLLYSINALDQCRIVFTSGAEAVYGVTYADPDETYERLRQTFNPYFRSMDASSYKVLTTVDTKRHLFDLAADHNNQYVAVVEGHNTFDEFLEVQENVCRLYEVGKRRDVDDLDDEQEELAEDHDDDGMSSSSEMDDTSIETTSTNSSSDEQSDDSEESSIEPSASHSDDDNDTDDDDDGSSDDDDHMSDNDSDNREMIVQIGNNDESFNIVFEGFENRHDRRNVRVVEAVDINSDDDAEMDESYNPDDDSVAESHPGSSSIVLNPVLRRQRRNEGE